MDSEKTGSAVPNMPSFIKSNKSKAIPWPYLGKFHILLSQEFYNLGYYVAKYPSYFIIIPIFVALLTATGVQALFRITDTEYLFTPSNGRGYYERGIAEQHFPVDYSHRFNPSRVTRLGSFANVLVSAKDDQSMFRSDVWNSLMKLDRSIRNITIRFEEIDYNYYDVCAKWQTECIKNPILELDDIMAALESGEEFVNYPIMLFPLIVPSFYGGAVINETEGVVLSVKSISLYYWFKEGNAKEKKRSQQFEQSILSLLDDEPYENLLINIYTSNSLVDESERTALAIVSYVVPTIILMVLVTSICMFSCDWVRCKIQIGLIGLLTVGLATSCSFGLLMYCKVPYIGLNLAAPFLVLGVGLDDMFVLISAWHRTDIRSEVEIRLAQTYSESAVSITITSVTNTLAFLLGSMSHVPSVNIFCVYIGVSMLVTYFYFLTFFGGCLALSGLQEKQNRHALTNKVVKSKSEAETLGTFYAILCAGGININDPDNPKDNTPPLLMSFFKEKFSNFLNNPFTKGFVLVSFLLYWSGAIYGCIIIKEGMEYRDFVLQDSYLVKYYNRIDELHRKYPHRIQIMINEKISYSDPQTKETLLGLHEAFENLTYIAPSIFTESWIRRFYKFLDRKPELRSQITDEASFIQVLRENFLTTKSADSLDVVFNEDGTQIVASRFIIQTYEISTTVEETEMMTAIRKVAKDGPFDVVAYHPLFLLYDTFLGVRGTTVQTISLVAVAMVIVSFIFIPNLVCSLCLTFSIISIIVGVMGYMSQMGVNMDNISMINLILCVGFSVDFSAHISYAYLKSKADSPSKKIEECMYNLGLPVIQSGITTMAGVFMFILVPSYAYHTFFKIVLLVVIFGMMHALFLIPVTLSLLGPGTWGKKMVQ